MMTVDLLLLPLGRGTDLSAERGVEAPVTCPPPPTPTWSRGPGRQEGPRRPGVRAGHHYQRDEVIEFADVTGDSFKLAWTRPAGRRPSSSSSAASTSRRPSRPTSRPAWTRR